MAGLFQILVISVGLSVDATSVSIIAGLNDRKKAISQAFRLAIFFGAFQALMPLIGFLVGEALSDIIDSYAALVGFILLLLVGAHMIYEAKFGEEKTYEKISLKRLLILSVATSIDALIVGVTLVLIEFPLTISLVLIFFVTFLFSFLGYIFGSKLGKIFGERIEYLGGVALILLGVSFLFM